MTKYGLCIVYIGIEKNALQICLTVQNCIKLPPRDGSVVQPRMRKGLRRRRGSAFESAGAQDTICLVNASGNCLFSYTNTKSLKSCWFTQIVG